MTTLKLDLFCTTNPLFTTRIYVHPSRHIGDPRSVVRHTHHFCALPLSIGSNGAVRLKPYSRATVREDVGAKVPRRNCAMLQPNNMALC